MSRASYVLIVTIFVYLPNAIECCTLTTSAMISLMSQPGYQSDPCYIQWKAEQDNKLKDIWARQDELQRIAIENNRIRMHNEAIERENRRNSYSTTSYSKKKGSPILKILGIIIGAIFGVCCCVCCISACLNEDRQTTTATNNPQSASMQAQQSTTLASVVSSNPVENQTTYNTNDNNNFSNLITLPSAPQEDSHANVPLMLRRQNSLPTYDDAVKTA